MPKGRSQGLHPIVRFTSPSASVCTMQTIEEKLTAQKQQAIQMLSDALLESQRNESAFLSAILTACDGCMQEVR